MPEIGVEVRHASFEGPIPSPDILREYEIAFPGTAERILIMAEKEQEERHRNQRTLINLEVTATENQNSNTKRGQQFALLSVLIIAALCAYLAYLGFAKEASYIACAVIVGLAGVFIAGQYKKKNTSKEQ